jgi:gas vesicle protein
MISKKDILEAIGADTDDRFMTGMLVGIGVGAIVGSAVAILLAPKTGTEIRQMLGERGSELIDKAKNRVGLNKNGGEQSSTGTGTGSETLR